MAEEFFWEGSFPEFALRLVAHAPPPDQPPLRVGDRCRLNSGGPLMTVLQEDTDRVLAVWYHLDLSVAKHSFARAAVRRVED